MDSLPKHVIRTLDAAIKDQYLISWRIFGEENVQITLKFTNSTQANTEYQYGSMDSQYAGRHFRSKPPSCISRDQARLVHFQDNKQVTSCQTNNIECDQNDIISTNQAENRLESTADDSGIGCPQNHTVLMSSTPTADQLLGRSNGRHNVTDANTTCAIFTEASSSQTDVPTVINKAIQTEKSVCRKSQTINFNSQYKRTQTLPLQTAHYASQADPIGYISAQSMTDCVEHSDSATNTIPPLTKHMQTHIVKTLEQSCGTTKDDASLQTRDTTKSKRVQVDTSLTTTLPLQGIAGSNVWVESAIDHILRNQEVLDDMTAGLSDLNSMCERIT